jgi:SpoVK/Ycf46/Vps4 family AAA+-type ATPase
MKSWTEIPIKPSAAQAKGFESKAAELKAADGAGPEQVTPTFVPRQPRRAMSDLIVPEAVRHRIDLALSQVDNPDLLYQKWNLKKIDPYRTGTALNFYGPSGTGKSLAAEAIASHRGQPLIDVSYAEIESKYVGDTPKNIVACFCEAAAQNAVLVFNEADSILGSRLSSVTQSSDHSVNVSRAVMLSQLDAFDGLVVFTTNFPRNYDAAFVRRILVHVRFDLPDEETRRALWAALIPAEIPGAAALDLDALAAASDGLSGGDMVNAVKAAAAIAVSRAGDDQVLRDEDLTAEIKAIRQAKSEVGKPPSREVKLISATPVDEVPADASPADEIPADAISADET